MARRAGNKRVATKKISGTQRKKRYIRFEVSTKECYHCNIKQRMIRKFNRWPGCFVWHCLGCGRDWPG